MLKNEFVNMRTFEPKQNGDHLVKLLDLNSKYNYTVIITRSLKQSQNDKSNRFSKTNKSDL